MVKKHKNISIRKANKNDMPEIVKLWKDLMKAHEGLYEPFKLESDAKEKYLNYITELLVLGDALILIAENSNAVVGYIVGVIKEYPPVFKIKKYGYIQEIYVHSKNRRKKVAALLASEIVNWFKSKEITFIELRALSNNETGIGFWKSQGFSKVAHTFGKKIK